MWKVKTPTCGAEEVAGACIRRAQDEPLKTVVRAAVPELKKNSTSYQAHAAAATLHATTASTFPLSNVSEAQMRDLYTHGLVRRKDGRRLYDRLMASALHGRCSYCQYGQAKTLDHFTPKESHASLSIEPWNLVPCCHQCNHELSDEWSSDPEHEPLHPYFMPDLGRWLCAAVKHTQPATVEFLAKPDSALPTRIQQRIRNQFERLRLGALYAVVSSQELTGLSRRLPDFGDPALVRAHLLEVAADAFASDVNDRRGVLMEALGNDDWYCNGGFA